MAANYLAFDIGGTSIKYAIIDSQLQIIHSGKQPTNHNRNQTIIKTLQTVSKDLMNEFSIQAIGISTAGRVGSKGEIIYAGPTVQDYQGTPLKRLIEEQTQLPVSVMNDVDAALMGEIFRGHHNRKQAIYCIALGTGIGGAFYLNGQLIDGAHNLGNSVGYLNYDPQTQTTFESRASTLAFERQLTAHQVSVPKAFQLARQGKQPFVSLIREWCEQLGRQIAQICLLLDPDVILIGGAVSQQGDFFIHQIKNAVHHYLPEGLDHVRIQATELRDQAQIFGAIAPFFSWKRIHLLKNVLG